MLTTVEIFDIFVKSIFVEIILRKIIFAGKVFAHEWAKYRYGVFEFVLDMFLFLLSFDFSSIFEGPLVTLWEVFWSPSDRC